MVDDTCTAWVAVILQTVCDRVAKLFRSRFQHIPELKQPLFMLRFGSFFNLL